MSTLTDNELNSMGKSCNRIVDKISNFVGSNPNFSNLEIITSYDIADYTARMTLAYLMRYGLLNKELFCKFGEFTDKDFDYINKFLENLDIK